MIPNSDEGDLQFDIDVDDIPWQEEPEEYDSAFIFQQQQQQKQQQQQQKKKKRSSMDFGSVTEQGVNGRKSQNLNPSAHHDTVVHLPEYLSDLLGASENSSGGSSALNSCNTLVLHSRKMGSPQTENTKLWKRVLVLAIAMNRYVGKLGLPLLLLIPVAVISWVAGLLILSLHLMVGIAPVVIYLIVSAKNRRQQLRQMERDFNARMDHEDGGRAQYDANNATYLDEEEQPHGKLDSEDEQEEVADLVGMQPQHTMPTKKRRARAQCTPSHVYVMPILGIRLSSTFWGILLPILFEIVSLLLFLLSFLAIVTNDLFTGWFWFLNLQSIVGTTGTRIVPLLLGFLHFLLAHFIGPFDLIRTLELNDRTCLYNPTAIVFHNVCLEQTVRTNFMMERGAVDMDRWEQGSSVLKRPVAMIDEIKDVSVAISLEHLHNRPINFPWLMIHSIMSRSSRNIDHKVLIPVQLPEMELRTRRARLVRFLSKSLRHPLDIIVGRSDRVLRIRDGFTVDESVELLQEAIGANRHDLRDNIRRVVRTLHSVQHGGLFL